MQSKDVLHQPNGLVFGVARSSRSAFLCHRIIHALLWIVCVASVNKNKTLDFVCPQGAEPV